MLEAHVFNALLSPESKATAFFSTMNFINGVVAPAFLFISGFAFVFSSNRKLDEFRKFKYQFWRQLGRIFLILLTGYLIHLPYRKFSLIRDYSSLEQLKLFYSVDILQCIAFGIFSLFVLRLLFKEDKNFRSILILLTVMINITSPWIWKSEFLNSLPLPIANYFVPHNGSIFPLFPWVSFMYAGAIFCSYYIKAKKENDEKNIFKKFSITGIIFVIIGYIVLFSGAEIFNELSMIRPNAFFVILRLGLVILVLVLFRFYEHKKGSSESFVTLFGRESFLIYWLHLQFIYRNLFEGVSLNSLVASRFNLIEGILTIVVLSVIMYSIAKIWQSLKFHNPELARNLLVAGLSIFGIYFFFF